MSESEVEDSRLTLDQWVDGDDPARLLRHAVAYCSLREISLVLIAVAERVWPLSAFEALEALVGVTEALVGRTLLVAHTSELG